MTPLDRKIAKRLQPLLAKAESGADFAEICRLEAKMIEEANTEGKWADKNSSGCASLKARCDCCDELVPSGGIARCVAFGIETFACDNCRGAI